MFIKSRVACWLLTIAASPVKKASRRVARLRVCLVTSDAGQMKAAGAAAGMIRKVFGADRISFRLVLEVRNCT